MWHTQRGMHRPLHMQRPSSSCIVMHRPLARRHQRSHLHGGCRGNIMPPARRAHRPCHAMAAGRAFTDHSSHKAACSCCGTCATLRRPQHAGISAFGVLELLNCKPVAVASAVSFPINAYNAPCAYHASSPWPADFSTLQPDCNFPASMNSPAPGVINADYFGARFTFYIQVCTYDAVCASGFGVWRTLQRHLSPRSGDRHAA